MAASEAIFPGVARGAGLYESFYVRAVSPEEPVGVWLRYTVHKRAGERAGGSVWCTVFDAGAGRPYMHKLTSERLEAPAGAWIAIGEESRLGEGFAQGACGSARWSLGWRAREADLRHLPRSWMYRAGLPRTKLTSPAPDASFEGTLELEGRGELRLDGWRGMVGHNWGSEHAERWVWLHGVDFAQDGDAWLDVALGRVRIGGRLTPWVANGAVSVAGERRRVGGLLRRGLRVSEGAGGCSVAMAGAGGLGLELEAAVPGESAAGWRYADPGGGGHEVVNCSVAALSLAVRLGDGRAPVHLTSAHGGAYELGMPEGEPHGVPLAPFGDG